jgi:bifunctional DNA-binding transcriptional regulator/antitoxin component of YhaV-PrlF toxin-antitoxin module
MDLHTRILMAKTSLWAVRERLKNGREKIEIERPDKIEYIQSSLKSEEEICKAELVIMELEDIIKSSTSKILDLEIKMMKLRESSQEQKELIENLMKRVDL